MSKLRGYDEVLMGEDRDRLQNVLEYLLEQVKNNDEYTYGNVYKKLEDIKKYDLSVSFEDYIENETLAYLEYLIDNDLIIGEYSTYRYSDDEIDYKATTEKLLEDFEYSIEDKYFELKEEYFNIYANHENISDLLDDSFGQIRFIRAKGIEDEIKEVYANVLGIDEKKVDIEDIKDRTAYMKICNYIDDTLYENELKDISCSKDKKKIVDTELEI